MYPLSLWGFLRKKRDKRDKRDNRCAARGFAVTVTVTQRDKTRLTASQVSQVGPMLSEPYRCP